MVVLGFDKFVRSIVLLWICFGVYELNGGRICVMSVWILVNGFGKVEIGNIFLEGRWLISWLCIYCYRLI